MATPSEADLVAAVTAVRDAHQDLGILKLWAQLKVDKPDWAVSEKRFRKALAAAGGAGTGGGTSVPTKGKSKKADGEELVAQTGLDPTLDVASIAPKVKARMFGGTRGKGLVAKTKIEMGEVLWQEDPWIACADPSLKRHLVDKTLCTHCLGMFEQPLPRLSAPCPTCYDAHFCNRLCLSRARTSASHHDLLCVGVNPAAKEINKIVEAREWRSYDIVARIIARWVGERAWGSPEAAADIEKRVWDGIARVSMETRESEKADWESRKDFTRRQWVTAHAAIVAALNPPDAAGQKRLKQILTSRARGRNSPPLTDAEVDRWFSYESFLQLLGMVNINLEDSGGLYALHAHLNHCCEPNIQVRNLPKSFVPPTNLPAELPGRNPPGVRGTHKLTILARAPIPPGAELTISYVDVALPRNVRRQALRDGYGFWCECARCEREKREEAKEQKAREAREKEVVARAAQQRERAEAAVRAVTAAHVEEVGAKMDELAVDDML